MQQGTQNIGHHTPDSGTRTQIVITKYRLGAREVNIQDMKLSYLSYGGDDGLCDGKNVRNCYRLVN